MEQGHEVAVIAVSLPAQGHLNQMLQLACLVSTYGLPVFFVGSALHSRQARVRVNGLSSRQLLKVEFHDIVTPPFASPPPNPNSEHKFPTQLQPMWEATMSLRHQMAAYLRDMANKFRRVVVVHDSMMAAVVQDVASILNAESYSFNSSSAFSLVCFIWGGLGSPFPVEHPTEPPLYDGLIPDEMSYFFTKSQIEPLSYRAGDIFNTSRSIEAPYLEVLEREEVSGGRKTWAIGPMLPAVSSSSNQPESNHKCLEWLDRQAPNSVIYVSFGTTVSMSDEQINELAHGLERSKVKFLWVLRDADKGDVFDGEVRKAELPEGFEERVGGEGMVVRDWAPQPQILGHASTGGFMGHCGWNSCLESITMGVPIAAWPMHSDQPMNTSFITDILKISIVVREWKQRSEVVKASTVENVVKRLMASAEGDEMRKRAEELRDTVQRAVHPGGASRLELESFIAHITR